MKINEKIFSITLAGCIILSSGISTLWNAYAMEENSGPPLKKQCLGDKQPGDNQTKINEEIFSAGSEFLVNGIVYVILDNTNKVSVKKAKTMETKINIPEFVNFPYTDKAFKVVKIGESAFERCENLVEIGIPEGVTIIDKNAFLNCWILRKVNLPNSIETIGYGAFEKTNLSEIKMPDNIKSIGKYAFNSCRNLEEMTVPNGCVSIGNKAFGCCEKLRKFKMPNSVTFIGKAAFSGCKNLLEINISSGVTAIEHSTFGRCKSLIEIIIPDSVKKIKDCAFYDCTSLSVAVSSQIEFGDCYVFYHCYYVDWHSDFVLTREKVKKILAVHPDLKETFYIPCGIKKIDNNAFEGLDIKKIRIPDSVTEIGDCAFRNCKNLEEISIPGGVRKIGEHAFDGSGIKRAVIKEGVKIIEAFAFHDCNSLKEINTGNVFPKSIKEIGESAFESIPLIDKITISGENTLINVVAFRQHIETLSPFKIIWDRIRTKPLIVRIPSSTIWEYPKEMKEDMEDMGKITKSTTENTYNKEELFNIFNFKVEIINPITNDTQTATKTTTATTTTSTTE